MSLYRPPLRTEGAWATKSWDAFAFYSSVRTLTRIRKRSRDGPRGRLDPRWLKCSSKVAHLSDAVWNNRDSGEKNLTLNVEDVTSRGGE